MPRTITREDFYTGGPIHPDQDPREALKVAGAEYLRAGLHVLALQGKAPHPKHSPHGYKEPIESPEAWDRAVADHSVTGIGAECTPTLFVVDIDGEEGWKALYEAGIFPLGVPTAVTITGRGAHFWFESPDRPVASRSRSRFLPGIDLKASGYVVMPPSEHPDGGRYRWKGASLVSNGFVYAADAPVELLELVEKLDHDDFMAGTSPYMTVSRSDMSPLVRHLHHAPEGERNETLNWCALRAGTNGLSLSEAMAGLLPMALAIGLTEKESKATIKSGWTAGNRQHA